MDLRPTLTQNDLNFKPDYIYKPLFPNKVCGYMDRTSAYTLQEYNSTHMNQHVSYF